MPSYHAAMIVVLKGIKTINVDKEMWEHAVILLSNE